MPPGRYPPRLAAHEEPPPFYDIIGPGEILCGHEAPDGALRSLPLRHTLELPPASTSGRRWLRDRSRSRLDKGRGATHAEIPIFKFSRNRQIGCRDAARERGHPV